ncbi:MAG: deoxyguanosinetriphosphate triphosphohydrolase [Verrucomicrobia bacterium]|nr:deoxyguanosinetriphosphate triphosphohydrolase [Verrucomicrobiota bacterium]
MKPVVEHRTRSRHELEQFECGALAPYAQRSRDSAGRVHPEPAHPYRTDYHRDRARIVHSRAFRRLEYKTQVFLNETGDHLRTRLTHTIEVASVSRSLACALGVNEDLAEVIALAHDLGHAPYGHSGESKLDELMRPHGGFEHNLQSLRVVEKLEIKYPAFPGLNLTHEVLEGLRKHHRGFDRPAYGEHPAERFPRPSLEAQLANIADEITYHGHDLDDGFDHGLVEVDQLKDLVVWRRCAEQVRHQFPALALHPRKFVTYTIRALIDFQVADVVRETLRRLNEAGVTHADDVRRHSQPMVSYSPELKQGNAQLRAFLFDHVYRHPSIAEVNRRGCEMIETVFHAYLHDPLLMQDFLETHGTGQSLERTVCDYVAGMTDRFLRQEYTRLTGKPGKGWAAR